MPFDFAQATVLLGAPLIVLAEVSNRLVIGNKTAREPHHLNVAAGLTLKPAARLNPIEIAVYIELEQY